MYYIYIRNKLGNWVEWNKYERLHDAKDCCKAMTCECKIVAPGGSIAAHYGEK